MNSRRREIVFWVVAGLLAVGLVAVSVVSYRNAKALTHAELMAALESTPPTKKELYNRFGLFTEYSEYITRTDNTTDIVRGLVYHPAFDGERHWIEGRGGAQSVRAFVVIAAVEDSSDHLVWKQPDWKQDGRVRSYIVFLGEGESFLGWCELRDRHPTFVEIIDWSRERFVGNES